ncbi:12621_t:CDS:1, partial [Racocetra persica]
EDQTGYSSPIAIRLSNKENQFIIHIAVKTIQKNIPYIQLEYLYSFHYINLPNNKESQ